MLDQDTTPEPENPNVTPAPDGSSTTHQSENGDTAKNGNTSNVINNTLSTDNSGGTTKAEAADTSDANNAMLPFVICIIAVGATSVVIRYKKSR